jgi:hypothetical protein
MTAPRRILPAPRRPVSWKAQRTNIPAKVRAAASRARQLKHVRENG